MLPSNPFSRFEERTNGSSPQSSLLDLKKLGAGIDTSKSNSFVLQSKDNNVQFCITVKDDDDITETKTLKSEELQNQNQPIKIELALISPPSSSSSSYYSRTTIDPLSFIRIHHYSDESWRKKNIRLHQYSTPREPLKYFKKPLITNPGFATWGKWLEENVLLYLKRSNSLPERIYPERFLSIFGMSGMGKLSHLATFCADHHINLMFIPNHYYTPTLFDECVEKAKKLEPCVMFFDKADYIFTNLQYHNEFNAIFSGKLDVIGNNIWVITSSKVPPMDIIQHAPLVGELFKESGSFVHLPVLHDSALVREYVIKNLSIISGNEDYPTSMLTSLHEPTKLEWNDVISEIVACSMYHTVREIYKFLISVFRSVLTLDTSTTTTFAPTSPSSLSLLMNSDGSDNSTIRLPKAIDFKKKIAKLPYAPNSNSQHVLTTRAAFTEYEEQINAWNSYLEVYDKPVHSFASTLSSLLLPTKSQLNHEQQRKIAREKRQKFEEEQKNSPFEFPSSSSSTSPSHVPPGSSLSLDEYDKKQAELSSSNYYSGYSTSTPTPPIPPQRSEELDLSGKSFYYSSYARDLSRTPVKNTSSPFRPPQSQTYRPPSRSHSRSQLTTSSSTPSIVLVPLSSAPTPTPTPTPTEVVFKKNESPSTPTSSLPKKVTSTSTSTPRTSTKRQTREPPTSTSTPIKSKPTTSTPKQTSKSIAPKTVPKQTPKTTSTTKSKEPIQQKRKIISFC